MAAEPSRRDLEQRAWQPGGEEILGSQESCSADLEGDPAVGGQRAAERARSEAQKAGPERQAGEEIQVFFGNVPAALSYWGLAPGEIGLYQINVVVPNVPASDLVPLTFMLAGQSGSQTLFTAVQ